MKLLNITHRILFTFSLWLYTQITWAEAALPWESPLQKIMLSISGPVAKMLGVIVIVLAGLGIAFGEAGSGVKRLFQVVMGLAIAFSAASIVASLYFQGSSGVM